MSLVNFIKPNKIKLHKSSELVSSFEFAPLEPGYGVTVGNALRRILLNSITGYAISAVKFPGIKHEFSSIKGVTEDVSEMLLNLKQIRLKKNEGVDVDYEKISISISNSEEFRAKVIQDFTPNFEISNPDFLVCRLDPSINLKFEIIVTKGRGYVPSEEITIKEESDIEFMKIDSIYTPIKNVKYNIENTRVGQRTDFEKLIIEIQTDGTINPEYALKQASSILIQHLAIITDENLTLELPEEEKGLKTTPIDDKALQIRKMLKTPLEDLDLSVRAFNCLKSSKINSLKDLVGFKSSDLIKFRNFGQKSLTEIEQVINERGLEFGMDLAKYDIEED